MKIATITAIAALALASPLMAQQRQYPMPPGIQELANQHIGLQGYNPYSPSCSPGMEDISRDEAMHGQ